MEIFQLETFYGPFTLGRGVHPWRRGSLLYWNFEDQNAARSAHMLGYVRYAVGDIDAGIGGFYWQFNEGPESQLITEKRAWTPPAATSGTECWIYVKYTNGRLFFNAEADWYYKTIRYQPSQDGSFFGDPAVLMQEEEVALHLNISSHGGTWSNLVAFPVQRSLAFSCAICPDLSDDTGFSLTNNFSFRSGNEAPMGFFIHTASLWRNIIEPGLIHALTCASGVAAGLLNYMVASNLDIVASIMLARRASYGYGYGYVRPDPNKPGAVQFKHQETFSNPDPSIPDRNLD